MAMATLEPSGLARSTSTSDLPPKQPGSPESAEEPSYLRDYLRPRLLPHVYKSSTEFVPWFQGVCGVIPADKKKTEGDAGSKADLNETWQDKSAPFALRARSAIFSLLFHLGSMLGNEIMYITFFPFVFWNIDLALGRRLVYMWCISMYLGQGLKDHLKLPRPRHCCPRVRSLEGVYTAEFGFPSTHVMAIMGQAFLIVVYTWREDYAGKAEYPLGMAIVIASFITTLTGLSRLYMGVHSVPDLYGGIFISVFILLSFLSFDNYLDKWLLESPSVAYVCPAFLIIMLLVYPRPRQFTVTYGDTAMIAGVGNGIALSSHLVNVLQYPSIPLNWLEVPIVWWLIYASSRVVIGFIIMVCTRHVAKVVCETTLVRVLPASSVAPSLRYSIVVPTKFITYTFVSFSTIALCPIVFNWLSICSASLDKHVLTLT